MSADLQVKRRRRAIGDGGVRGRLHQHVALVRRRATAGAVPRVRQALVPVAPGEQVGQHNGLARLKLVFDRALQQRRGRARRHDHGRGARLLDVVQRQQADERLTKRVQCGRAVQAEAHRGALARVERRSPGFTGRAAPARFRGPCARGRATSTRRLRRNWPAMRDPSRRWPPRPAGTATACAASCAALTISPWTEARSVGGTTTLNPRMAAAARAVSCASTGDVGPASRLMSSSPRAISESSPSGARTDCW